MAVACVVLRMDWEERQAVTLGGRDTHPTRNLGAAESPYELQICGVSETLTLQAIFDPDIGP